jgi:hypothetical protein
MVETRIAPRHRVMKAGTIEFGSSAIDCTVRNLSITGAALEVSNQRHPSEIHISCTGRWVTSGLQRSLA